MTIGHVERLGNQLQLRSAPDSDVARDARIERELRRQAPRIASEAWSDVVRRIAVAEKISVDVRRERLSGLVIHDRAHRPSRRERMGDRICEALGVIVERPHTAQHDAIADVIVAVRVIVIEVERIAGVLRVVSR